MDKIIENFRNQERCQRLVIFEWYRSEQGVLLNKDRKILVSNK